MADLLGQIINLSQEHTVDFTSVPKCSVNDKLVDDSRLVDRVS